MQKNNTEKILQKLVGTHSYVPYENALYAYLASFLQKRGFYVEYQTVTAKRRNLLAYRGKSNSSVLIYMHVDTVPPHGHDTKALTLRKVNGNYYGLGCFDMKGGIAAILEILDRVRLQTHTLKLAFCVDEEGISEGVYALSKSLFIKDVVVAFSPEASIVPDSWDLPLMLTIGGRGRSVFHVTIPGQEGHGASDSREINSVGEFMRFVSFLSKWRRGYDKKMGPSSFFIRSIHADSEGLSFPFEVKLSIDYQTVYGQTALSVKKSLEIYLQSLYKRNVLHNNLIGRSGVSFALRSTPFIEPYKMKLRDPYVRLVSRLFRKRYGHVSYDWAKSVADQNVLAAAGVPIITIGPVGGKPHEPDEWVSIRSLQEVSEFYCELLSLF